MLCRQHGIDRLWASPCARTVHKALAAPRLHSFIVPRPRTLRPSRRKGCISTLQSRGKSWHNCSMHPTL